MSEIIRRVRLTPYRKGAGPSFTLTMRDTGRTDSRGCTVIAYTLRASGEKAPIFDGADFSPGRGTCDDSDACVRGLLGFLTLRPGDTDADYFATYTDAQRAFCDAHAEALSWESICRFGEG